MCYGYPTEENDAHVRSTSTHAADMLGQVLRHLQAAVRRCISDVYPAFYAQHFIGW